MGGQEEAVLWKEAVLRNRTGRVARRTGPRSAIG
jgi:hypothetical protein